MPPPILSWGGSVIHAADSWSYPTSKPDGKFGGGSGSSYDPYLINNAQQLADLAYLVNDGEEFEDKYFKLTNDITFNDDVIADDGKTLKNSLDTYKHWIPIGDYGTWVDNDFMGYFDGCGHKIKGMVCTEQTERYAYGLFGCIDNTTIKNLNMEDCYVDNISIVGYSEKMNGILCGNAYESTFQNCHVSISVVRATAKRPFVGGLIGAADFAPYKGGHTYIVDCSFSGNIFATLNYTNDLSIGGIVGRKATDDLTISNCYSDGDIIVNQETELPFVSSDWPLSVGGIMGCCEKKTEAYGCVSRMNITINFKSDEVIEACFVGGIASTTKRGLTACSFKECAYLGTITIGSQSNKAIINSLYVSGIFCEGGTIINCAFYGRFDVHAYRDKNENTEYKDASFASLCKKYMSNPQDDHSVIYSVGNVIDIDFDTYDECMYDQVCCEMDNSSDRHQVYYHFECSNGSVLPCKFTANSSTYNKTIDELKTGDFIKTLNNAAGSYVWGKLTGMSDESLNGLPMPIACGGTPIEYSGDGSLDKPYIINTEADLNQLKDYVNNGRTFEGKYFKLGSDISITGTLDECIGKDYDHPFKGHFDGNGHAIVGLRKSLFGYMYGKVKNLALVDCDIWVNGYATALATQVGNKDNYAEVSNCYVSGIIASSTPWNQQGCASTFAFQVADGSSIHDCYFKGRFVLKEQTFNTCYVAGIAVYNSRDVNTSAESPQGIFNCYASFDVKEGSSGNTSYYCYGICNRNNDSSSGNYFVCSNNRLQPYNGGTKLDSETLLNEKFKDKSAWLQGVYRPVLASAKNYAATTPETTPETVYFDAIPEANPTANYFYNISIDDPYSDVSLWSLPNMAVYVPSEQKDYITNGNLVQSADFQYKRSAEATATAGQLRYELTQNASGYHMLCLPGVVERGDLPKGSKVMIYGKIRTNVTSQEINEVHVDTIPAGVPCILYIPTSTYAVGSKIPLVMRSEIRSEPLLDANYSNMKGTFKTVANVSDACITADKHEDGEVYFKKSATTLSMKPFTAWLEGATGDKVQIVDYVLLDEENEAMTVTLAGLNSTVAAPKTTNVKMRRTVKLGQWNTICLPFDLTKTEVEDVFGSSTKVEELSSLNYDATSKSYTLVFAAVKEADGSLMKAGVPYLIKPGTTKTEAQTYVQLYAFTGKNIICPADSNYMFVPAGKVVTNTEKSTKLTMQGEYNHRMITPDEATDGKSLYVISGDKIYYVNSEVEMKGFRCYFVAEESAAGSTTEGASLFRSAKVMHADGTSTDLRLIKADATGEGSAVYDLLGRKRDEQTKGIVIVNGKKIIIKQEKK